MTQPQMQIKTTTPVSIIFQGESYWVYTADEAIPELKPGQSLWKGRVEEILRVQFDDTCPAEVPPGCMPDFLENVIFHAVEKPKITALQEQRNPPVYSAETEIPF